MAEVTEQSPRGTASVTRAGQVGAWPGLRQAATVVMLSGLACWFWALPQLASRSRPSTADGMSALAEVAADDIPAALATMDGSSSFLAQWRRPRDCSHRLAWVTVARRPGGLPGTVRLKSGPYFSPVFTLSDAPRARRNPLSGAV